MKEIVLKNHPIDDLLNQLNYFLEGEIVEQGGVKSLVFNNIHGKGTIRTISFDWGISLIDYDVNFLKDIKIVYETGAEPPLEFIFISEGKLGYIQGIDPEEVQLERYQNIIIAPKKQSKKTLVFPKRVNVQVNIIHILKKQYAKKKHNNLAYFNDVIRSVFKDESVNLPYKHLGNFNLKIADHVKEIRADKTYGAINALSIEGRLNIILAMQLLEQHKFETEDKLSDSLSVSDIKKIHKLAGYIVDNIAEPITIAILSEESGLSAKKLQLGFRMLYEKSVNEYVKKIKLEISRDYLKNTDYSISEVVYKVGIKSRSYFSKIFSEHYGILPTEYRKKIKLKSRN
ncbi:AraC family transcriptional regulator [uncultured Winogradskyella sp.]|uniref:helix-turn-helix domain-containing protein n=1 Tax=uncultured Winogradskyella sp. TaxID=395353 RepID=UPI00262931C7|nr:AraC family transcriptional regulator [uncultured Winogradskyella sp.]